ncbi:MAG: DUF262 domain-containing protein [Chloroflexi bacterium]|nr:DUF262 domain-containing protein [Chloroflexota bacterium]
MLGSVLQQYQVSDFIEWWDRKQLEINQDFQRRAVWTPAAKSYLIQTVLRQMPMPKVYLRTKINVVSQVTVREIVDGQQRLRAILDFGKGKLRLTKRAEEFSGMTYDDLDDDQRASFLSYRISVEQLVNATDDDVLEVFARLNSYTVPLNAPELRHAKFQGDFKWKVRHVSVQLAWFWNKYTVLTTRDRLRMLDDSLTAEMFGIVLEGVKDGGQPKITRLYERYENDFPMADEAAERVFATVRYVDENFEDELKAGLFSSAPHLLILFAAVAHAFAGIPQGDIKGDMPSPAVEIALDVARANLAELTQAVSDGSQKDALKPFVRASSGSTQRIASRKVRFLTLHSALSKVL